MQLVWREQYVDIISAYRLAKTSERYSKHVIPEQDLPWALTGTFITPIHEHAETIIRRGYKPFL